MQHWPSLNPHVQNWFSLEVHSSLHVPPLLVHISCSVVLAGRIYKDFYTVRVSPLYIIQCLFHYNNRYKLCHLGDTCRNILFFFSNKYLHLQQTQPLSSEHDPGCCNGTGQYLPSIQMPSHSYGFVRQTAGRGVQQVQLRPQPPGTSRSKLRHSLRHSPKCSSHFGSNLQTVENCNNKTINLSERMWQTLTDKTIPFWFIR